MKMLNWFKKPHVHKPHDPVGVAVVRAHKQSDQVLFWRCDCGEMVKDG